MNTPLRPGDPGYHAEPWKDEPDAPAVEHKTNGYQLYFEDVTPCRYHLAVNGAERQPISLKELSGQGSLRTWHLKYRIKPPRFKRGEYDYFLEKLLDEAIKIEGTLPFMRTDAGRIDALAQYFIRHIPNMVRARGNEFLAGKGERWDSVRVKWDQQRIYFKWGGMGFFCQNSLNMSKDEMEELKIFITKKGGYQDEHTGREWFRCTYWIRMDIFDAVTLERWFEPDKKEDSA
jgi:hypothetical protein